MLSTEAKLLRATAFAAHKHTSQRRKNVDASPYINHPIEVAELLATIGDVSDIELLMAAILHDTVEDTKTSFSEIEEVFGADVRSLVAEVTDDKSLEKQQRKQLQIETAAGKSDRAKLLKIADKICNIRDMDMENPDGWDTLRKLQYLEWANQVVRNCRGLNQSLDQLFDQTVEQARAKLT